MKIIINQDKELRIVGYDESIGCNPLKTEFYIAKVLNPDKPVYCLIDSYRLPMYINAENENYFIYKPFDIIDISYEEGYKELKIDMNGILSKKINIFFNKINIFSLSEFLMRKGTK